MPDFTRGDVAIISNSALNAIKKGTSKTLKSFIFGDEDAVSTDFKQLMDEYEAFIDKYCEFMKSYNASDFSMLSKYIEIMGDYSQWMLKIEKLDSKSMTTADALYYSEVTLRCAEKLSKAA